MSRPALNPTEWMLRVLAGHYNNGNDDEPARILTFYYARRAQGLIQCMQTAHMDYQSFVTTGLLPPYIQPDFDRVRNREEPYVVPARLEIEVLYLLAAE